MPSRYQYQRPPRTSKPDWRETPWVDIWRRGEPLLAGRSAKEIRALLATVNTLTHRYHFDHLAQMSANQDIVITSPTLVLRHALKQQPAPAIAGVDNVRWAELFAALARGIASFVFERAPAKTPATRRRSPAKTRFFNDPQSLEWAGEALAVAESLSANPDKNAGDRAQNLLRQQKSKAARKGHGRRREIHQRFCSYHCEHGGFATENARRFYRGLSAADRRLISPHSILENAVRNLTAALRRSRRA